MKNKMGYVTTLIYYSMCGKNKIKIDAAQKLAWESVIMGYNSTNDTLKYFGIRDMRDEK